MKIKNAMKYDEHRGVIDDVPNWVTGYSLTPVSGHLEVIITKYLSTFQVKRRRQHSWGLNQCF